MRCVCTLLILITFGWTNLNSQSDILGFYDLSLALIEDVNSVILSDVKEVNIKSVDVMQIEVKRRVMVLNEAGKSAGDLYLNFNPSTRIQNLNGLINPGIQSERRISGKDIKDVSYGNMFSLYGEERLRIYKHIPIEYPYVIEFSYRIISKNTAFIPAWRPYSSAYQNVVKSHYTVSWPTNVSLSKHESGLSDFPISQKVDEYSVEYKLINGQPLKKEKLGRSFYDLSPRVVFALSKFRIEGYVGEAESWEAFGLWMHDDLISDQNKLSKRTKDELEQLVYNVEDPIERAKIVYKYVQDKTRYISVQVGIGGWQPMGADEVDKLGYGDCKALTNYTKTLMDLANVESYYAVIYAGENKRNIIENIVGVQGNHVLLYLPHEEKDYWLECTSQTLPFGYQGTFTDHRNALIISENESRLIQTAGFKDDENVQRSIGHYVLGEDRSLLANIEVTSAGVKYQNKYQLQELSETKIDEYYTNKAWPHLSDLNLIESNFQDDQERFMYTENLKIQVPYYCEKVGPDLMFEVNAFNQIYHRIGKDDDREQPFIIRRGEIEYDDFTFEIPLGYVIRELPDEIVLDESWGTYLLKVTSEEGSIYRVRREMQIKPGEFPKEKYVDYLGFMNMVEQGDRTQIVLKRNL